MKKKLAILLACALGTCALCFALVGCSGGGTTTDPAKNFTGYWEISSMTSADGTDSADTISLMKALGLTCSITLNEDKTGELNFFDEILDGTWSAKDASTATFSSGGDSIDMTLADGKLSLTVEGDSLVFSKGTAPTTSGSATTTTTSTDTAGTSASSGTAAASDKVDYSVTIADDDVCSIVVTSKALDWADDPGYNMTVTNKSDKDISLMAQYGTFSVNGKMVEPFLAETVKAGKYADVFMYFSSSDVTGGLDGLVGVEGDILVYDATTYEDIATYSVKL